MMKEDLKFFETLTCNITPKKLPVFPTVARGTCTVGNER